MVPLLCGCGPPTPNPSPWLGGVCLCVSLSIYGVVCVYVFLGVSVCVCVKPEASRGRSRSEPRRRAEGGARMRLSAQRLAGTAGARSGLKRLSTPPVPACCLSAGLGRAPTGQCGGYWGRRGGGQRLRGEV